MTVAIMQPYFLPYIGYWQLISAVDKFIIYDDVNYINKGYINRNNILVNKQKYTFTLELLNASQNKLINEIDIGNNRDKLLKTINMSYKKAPFFEETIYCLENIFLYKDTNLSKFIANSLIKISEYLQIDTKFIFSSDIEKNNTLKGQDKIIDIVNKLGATNYINAIGGETLYIKDTFRENDIQLNFIKTDIKEYKQFNQEFIPYLSIVDIMMFNSIDDIKIMLKEYKLI